MRPLTFGNATPEHLQKRLFLLNPKLLAVHYLDMALNRGRNIFVQNTTQKFIIPTQLRDLVLDRMVMEATRPRVQYQFVTATPVQERVHETEMLLRWVRQEFVLPADGENRLPGANRFPEGLDNDPAMT